METSAESKLISILIDNRVINKKKKIKFYSNTCLCTHDDVWTIFSTYEIFVVFGNTVYSVNRLIIKMYRKIPILKIKPSVIPRIPVFQLQKPPAAQQLKHRT